VARAVQREIVDYREFTGHIEAVESTEVRVRVRGFLQKIHFKEGTEVKQGDLLYEIDPRTHQADLDRAIAEARHQEAQLALARSEEERAVRLRGTPGALPEEDVTKRIATRQAAEAMLQQARAAVASAQLELGFTRIRAPIAGRIGRALVTEGNLVGYNEPTLLTTIVRIDPVYVFFDVPESEFLDYQRLIREEDAAAATEERVPVFVGLGTEEDFPHEGVINFRDNRVDPGTGTIQLRAELPNPQRALVPGLFARVRVPIGKAKPRILVPELALSSDQRGQFVLVVQEDNTVDTRMVQTGRVENGKVVVLSGLRTDDWVIINGLQRARPGTKVNPVREGEPAPAAPPPAQPPPGAAKS